jgi:hypothetical protein
MIARYGVEDSVAGFSPLAQTRRRSLSDPRGEALPSVFRNGGEECLQAVVVVDAGLRAKDWTPWRGRFPQTTPMRRFTGDGLVATDPRADVGIVPRKLLARDTPSDALKDVPP